MTREELDRMMFYHAAEASFTYLKDNFSERRELETGDITEAFVDGAEWAQKFFIDNACLWLRETAHFYVSDFTGELDDNRLIEDFKKAMEK